VFDTADDLQIFVGVVTDTQWRIFCEMFNQPELAADLSLQTNSQRVAARERVLPRLRALFKGLTRAEAAQACEKANLPFAPITRPDELFGDPQLNAPGAMVEVSLPGGGSTLLPALPLEFGGERFGRRLDIPKAGEHSEAIAEEIGIGRQEIDALRRDGILGAGGG
jgi:crotonobetainyl-CoA:carnitine CoA-transferase CaiB-like acyl-CoA transferase